jgi:hypothetical protein
MSIYKYRAGIGNVGSYQSSGSPFVTGSIPFAAGQVMEIDFPRVTKQITITTTDSSAGSPHLYFYFHEDASDLNKFPVGGGKAMSSLTIDVKCTKLFLSSSASGIDHAHIYASLTAIEPKEMFPLTGSGITE